MDTIEERAEEYRTRFLKNMNKRLVLRGEVPLAQHNEIVDVCLEVAEYSYKEGAYEQEMIDRLSWKDVKRIVEMADKILNCQTMGFLATEEFGWSSEEAYYTEVLRRFKEEE